jgi:hypothetical protein
MNFNEVLPELQFKIDHLLWAERTLPENTESMKQEIHKKKVEWKTLNQAKLKSNFKKCQREKAKNLNSESLTLLIRSQYSVLDNCRNINKCREELTKLRRELRSINEGV